MAVSLYKKGHFFFNIGTLTGMGDIYL